MWLSPEGSCRLYSPVRTWMSLLDGSSLRRESPLSPQKPLYPWKEKSQVSKNMENYLLFHIWKTEGPGAAALRDPCRWVLADPISILLGSSGTPTPQASVGLLHPVPAFITVLSVLFSLNNFSVAPTEESQLSWERNNKKGFWGWVAAGAWDQPGWGHPLRDHIRTGKHGTF